MRPTGCWCPGPDSRLRRGVILPAVATLLVCVGAELATAASLEDVPLPGGTRAIAAVLGVTQAPDRARLLPELTRLVHAPGGGRSTEARALQEQLLQYFETVDRFQAALAAEGTGLTLATAGHKDNRKRLTALLDLIGLEIVERKNTLAVEPSREPGAAARQLILGALGIDAATLANRLNGGGAVQVEISTEMVPVPLTAAFWERTVFDRPVPPDRLFAALMSDRRAALLACGLASLDESTLQYFAGNPQLVKRIYAGFPGVFCAFARGLRIVDGRLETPGGVQATPLWEAAVDEKVTHPDRFVERMFGRTNARLAYLFDTIAHLDEPRARFALGFWIDDRDVRLERFRTLARLVEGAYHSWDIELRPSQRMPYDVAMLLNRVAVTTSGAPVAPAGRAFWTRALVARRATDGSDLQNVNVDKDSAVDAAYLVEQLALGVETDRSERIGAFLYAQRVFHNSPQAAYSDVIVAVRAFFRQPMLVLALERMGIVEADAYAAIARLTTSFSTLGRADAFAAFGQTQSALALVARLRLARVITPATATTLVRSLAASAETTRDSKRGDVLNWLRKTLADAIGLSSEDIEGSLVRALAGAGSTGPGAAPITVVWEDRRYTLDLAAGEVKRIQQARQRYNAPTLNQALTFIDAVERITAKPGSLPDLQAAAAALETAASSLRPEPVTPAGLHKRADPQALVARTLEKLTRIRTPGDFEKVPQTVEPLTTLADELLTDSLMALVYAVSIPARDATTLPRGSVARRHDFGFQLPLDEQRRREPWRMPSVEPQAGVPWHVSGSMLGLDVGLAMLALRRLSDTMVDAPTLSANETKTLARAVTLANPFDLGNEERDLITAAIARGRERVRGLAARPDDLDAVAGEARLDGLRRRQLQWVLREEPARVLDYLSLAELLVLGGPSKAIRLDVWGSTAMPFGGCMCTSFELPLWNTYTGRISVGLLGSRLADLNFRVAELTAEAGLPAAVIPSILDVAMQELIDQVRMMDDDDWLTLVRTAQSVTRERLEDYAAGLTVAGGPLVPAGSLGPRKP